MSQSGFTIAGKTGQVYCLYCTRATLISMEEVKNYYAGRHLISMEEPKVITIDDVIDSTVMDINKGNPLFARESRGNPRGTQGEPSNPDNSNEYRLLFTLAKSVFWG